MTKSEAKKKIWSILDKVNELSEAIKDLYYDVYKTCNEIKPYEGRNELTQAQEKRLEWFSDLNDKLTDAENALEIFGQDLEEVTFY